MYNSTESALIVTLTIGELKGLIAEILGEAMHNSAFKTATQSNNLVYGIRGIEKLFGVSHKTAQYYKDNVIREAVMQNGRKIVVDAVNGNQKCSIFGNYECSDFGIKTAVDSATMVQ